MSELFLNIVNMSIAASWIVIALLLIRLMFKKAPKWITLILWGIVAIRLVCPLSFESILSLIPSPEVVSPAIMEGIIPEANIGGSLLNVVLVSISDESFMPVNAQNVNTLQTVIPILAIIWIVGIAALIAYAAISYYRIRQKTGTAVLLKDNIYQSERVKSPYVFGILRPKIYLPFNVSEQHTACAVAHEQAHISRKDHIWKLVGYILLAIHWFNPIMWLGYILFCRDIEFACDEKVIKTLDCNSRADYSETLLACSVNRRMFTACPLAFGEVGVKARVKSVLDYKKPGFRIIILTALVSIIVAICFLTNPINAENHGINDIQIKNVSSDMVELNIKYTLPSGSYRVCKVPENEGEYIGDGMVDYDGSIGKYRIMIQFGDIEFAKNIADKYRGGVIELLDSSIPIKMKCAMPADQGVVIYLGFDRPVDVEALENGNLNPVSGTIKIPIELL